MPAPDVTENYVRIRVRNPDLFVDDSFATITLDSKKGIKAVIGKLKTDPNGSTKIQSYLFDKDKWTVEEAQQWVNDHGKSTGWLFGENIKINLSEWTEEKMQSISKLYDCELKDFSERERAFTAIASTETVDRDGDILLANGWKLKNYRKNPVVLWGHDANNLPIAKAKDIKAENGKLAFRPQFATAEMNPLAEQIFQMFKSGFLRAFSVRFDPIEWEDIEQSEGKQTNPFRQPRIYKSLELLEISAVNIPANPEALKSSAMHDLIVKSYIADNLNRFPNQPVSKIWNGTNIIKAEEKQEFECECIKCGFKMKSEKHCKDIKCPECGGQMRRAERPGSGQANYDFSEELKDKYGKLDQLKREKEIRIVEQKLDDEIALLEKELNDEKAREMISVKLKALHSGITALVKK